MRHGKSSFDPASAEAARVFEEIGLPVPAGACSIPSPIDGSAMPGVQEAQQSAAANVAARAIAAFQVWRSVPAPVRGQLVKRFGAELTRHRDALGRLITLEVGKTLSEGVGEVQEAIDMCDFAVGLSRQLHGLTIVSERPDHHMREAWHPLGPVAIISAFNFPVAVWAWNACLALVCGDSIIWKPSEKAPLSAIAMHGLLERAMRDDSNAPADVSQLLIGGRAVGEALVDCPEIALVSATGSVAMGRAVGTRVAARFGRVLLELGGNAATIVAPSADLDLAVRAIAFGATGTAGQRCTTMRRLLVHADVYDALVTRLKAVFARLPIGDPREALNLIGPLIDERAVQSMSVALERAKAEGGVVAGGARIDGLYVHPALVEMPAQTDVMREETFAPILYVLRYNALAEAIAVLRDAPQGLSSSIITNDLRESEMFLSCIGSDCGIANVNMGTSGAEIGGAFGGEKETGGGREAGSDSWRAYMRRQTQAINYGRTLPLAQGVRFDV
jgi:aldehyde dehydrogenase (NAD+)